MAKDDKIYTEDKVAICKRIADGRTILIPGIGWDQEKEAMELALKNRTYSVPAYQLVKGRLQQYGYAIPK